MKTLLATTTLITLAATSAFAGECSPGHHKITNEEITAAQKAWGDGIVAIGKAEDHKKSAI